MANINTEVPTVAFEASGKDENELQTGLNLNGKDQSGPSKSSGGNSCFDSTEKRTTSVVGDTIRTPSATRPTLVQLGSSSSTAPQPKRFSTVNVTKKFLEKNSPASAPLPSSQLAPVTTGGTTNRPQIQPTPSHSRLVTAKLTSISPASSGSAGWSRPSSAAPPNVAGSHSPAEHSPRSADVPLGASNPVAGAPQLPHAGKVIQPQPKSALPSKLSTDKSLSGGSGKAVWGNVKAHTTVARPTNEFPTAAEVAHVSAVPPTSRQPDSEPPTQAATLMKQARMEEADTFRGVHLDPNAHHWDEMEEDDDNFLDGVIEFGDGRQYKIEATETPRDTVPLAESTLLHQDPPSNVDMTNVTRDSIPVRKEDRFVDDFDRSWPRSRNPPGLTREAPTSSPSLPAKSGAEASEKPLAVDGIASNDGPRALFNERSNRLEPYTNTHPRTHRGSFHERDSAASPSESRFSREVPWGSRTGSAQAEFPARSTSRRFSNTSSTGSGSYARDRDYPPTSPRIFKEPLAKERESRTERPRRSDMGPPPVPPHALKGENRRQLPPHLSPVSPTQSLAHTRASPRESRFYSPGTEHSYSSPLQPPSPALSHSSAVRSSPITSAHILPPFASPQLEAVQKDLMHTAAERAKERRQQEEAERERERERARRKAAEIEAQLKGASTPVKNATKEESESGPLSAADGHDEAVAFLEDTVKSVRASDQSGLQIQNSISQHTATSHLLPEPSKTPETARNHLSPVSGQPDSKPPPFNKSMSSDVQSWRTGVGRSIPPTEHQTRAELKVPELVSNTAMDRVETLVATSTKDLEVVDFSDMEKFTNVVDRPTPNTFATPEKSEMRPPRAIASDFFEDVKVGKTHAVEDDSWRSKQTGAISGDVEKPISASPEASLPSAQTKSPISSSNDHPHYYPSHQPAHLKNQRSQPSYKMPPMSTLDDTMSRIKGALDGMQTALSDGSRSNASGTRWVPPALRPRDHEVAEAFSTTLDDPPLSPLEPPSFKVRLPMTSKPLEPVHRRQLTLFFKPTHVRWEVLSFDPPVEGMNKRDFSLNNLLFRKPYVNQKGQVKYRIHLPRTTMPRGHLLTHGPKHDANSVGRSTVDGPLSWRKPKDSSTTESPEKNRLTVIEEPREPISALPQSKAETAAQFVRPRALPKMPDGSGVAFYRDSRIDTVKEDAQPSVSFFVASELEHSSPSSSHAPSSARMDGTVSTNSEQKSERRTPVDDIPANHTIAFWPPESIPTNHSEKKNTSVSADSTPLKTRSSWSRSSLSKDSPSSRGPDPELLKAVWSQTSNQPGSHGINSLQAIADDLTALPFTISEVKSEDGETPPTIASGPPSRMSLHEVTRAFQQVPTASNSSSPRRSPPQNANIIQQQRASNPTFTYPPQQTSALRSGYHYPSPVINHSPAPGVMYHAPVPSSPMPSRMQVNGTNHIYNQPMWMPGPAAQQQNGMLRPVASPYHSPLVYPHLAPYPPGNLQQQQQPQPPVQGNRDRPLSMVSPVMAHTGPAMYGSPVMMHTPMGARSAGYIVPPQANHGAPRSDNHQGMAQRGRAQPNSTFSYASPQYERSW